MLPPAMERIDDAGSRPALEWAPPPPGWTPGSLSPPWRDGAWGPGWSLFEVVEDPPDRLESGRRPDGLHALEVGRGCPSLGARLIDFLRYERAHGRRVILSAPPGVDRRGLVQRSLAALPADRTPREDDPRWLVHSTTRAAWEQIREAGELRSLAALRRLGVAVVGLGAEMLGDPDDYAEHVTLAAHDCTSPENVVASRALGRVVIDAEAPYAPGARLYIDGHRLVRDGLAVRDGVHTIKVRDRLPLAPYLLAVATAEAVDPAGGAVWTPRRFVIEANRWFMAQRGARGSEGER